MITLYIVILLSLIPSLYFAFHTKDLPFFLPEFKTDNEKMLTAGSKIKLFDWPSKMHTIENLGEQARSQSREYWTIMCSIFLKLFKNSKNDHVTILIGLFANFISTILIYFIFSNYFDQSTGLIVSMMYLTSFWSYHIVLFIGHVVLSQMFFLLSVLFTQMAADQQALEFLFYFLAGSFALISFQSSSASMKYPPLALLAFLFAIRHDISITYKILELDLLLIFIPIFLSIVAIFAFIHRKEKPFFKKLLIFLILLNFVMFFILCFISVSTSGLTKIFAFLLGLFLIFFHITLPFKTFVRNVNRLIVWRNNNQFVNHFIPFSKLPVEDQIKIFKKPMPSDFSGGDLFWNLKVYNIFMPFLFPIYILSILLFLVLSIYDLIYFNNIELLKNFFFLLFISLLPTIVHETTLGLKVAKAYFSTILSFLIFPFAFIYNLEMSSLAETADYYKIFKILMYTVCFLQLLHTIKILRETLDSRIYVKKLYNFLIQNKITEFNTYDNMYNDNFVKNMILSFPNKFKINYIKSVDEIKNKTNKILVVPPITSKVLFFNSVYKALVNGFFNEDLTLIKLIETKQIEKYSIQKFKTMSSYPYYIYDDEVLSYISIYLNGITDEDRYKGFGWVLDLNSR